MKGESIKAVLKQYNISNNELAAKMGMTPQNLSQLLSKDDVKSGTLERISQASGISIAVLYGEPTQAATVSGDNSTAVAGNGNQVNAGKLIDEVAAQRRLTEAALVQNDKLIAIIETITKKQ